MLSKMHGPMSLELLRGALERGTRKPLFKDAI